MKNTERIPLNLNLGEVEGRLRHEWPAMPLGPLENFETGEDHRVYVAGQRFVVRVPVSASARTHLQYEMAKLSHLRLPAPIPQYCWKASWVGVYPILEGRPASQVRLGNSERTVLATQVADFLNTLHRPEYLPERRQDIRVQRQWEKRLARLRMKIEEEVYALLSHREVQVCRQRFAQYIEGAERFQEIPALLHGGFTVDHVLIGDTSQLTGIIDFGDMAVGDPIYDWAGLPPLWDPFIPQEFTQAEKLRREFYRALISIHQFFHAVTSGDVQEAEQNIHQFRKWLEM